MVNSLYENTTDENEREIQKDIMRYYYRDEFTFVLNNNIKNFLEEKNKEFLEQLLKNIILIIFIKTLEKTEILNNVNFKVPTPTF